MGPRTTSDVQGARAGGDGAPGPTRAADPAAVHLLLVDDLPPIEHRSSLGALIAQSVDLQEGDILVIDSRMVSVAEGRTVAIGSAREERERVLASESVRTLRAADGPRWCETRHGFVLEDAGIRWERDGDGAHEAILLPVDPDRSAHKVRNAVAASVGSNVGVVIAAPAPRPWRTGSAPVAIGSAGVAGAVRSDGTCTMDAIAACATIAAAPVVIVRGAADALGQGSVRHDVVVPANRSLFH